ncbi:MAG: InlB B-repeat-containing protein [Bacteroidales bacterium]|nr:InlB B-repeat-containing protein [Bacteroidales bacterium]
MRKFYKIALSCLLLLAAAQVAQAAITQTMTLEGHKKGSGYTFSISGFLGTSSKTTIINGSCPTYNAQFFNLDPGRLTITGTLNFADANVNTDITTGSEVTLVFSCKNPIWLFYDATVKNKAGNVVSGCTATPAANNTSITVTIPSGKAFNTVELSVAHPISLAQLSGIPSTYIDDCVNEPAPTLVYQQETLTPGTDYTVSYANNEGAGTATLTVTGMGAFADSRTKDFTISAVTLSDFTSLGNNTYEIADKQDLAHLAAFVNHVGNACSGLTFKQTADIVCDDTYTPIGCRVYNGNQVDRPFSGTYDGQEHTISGITVSRTGNHEYTDSYLGVFGYATSNATIENIFLFGSSFTGYRFIGGISGYRGLVTNCRVESSVTIQACADGSAYLGGIAGSGSAVGCVSAAAILNNEKQSTQYYGGIVGNQEGRIDNNLYIGTIFQPSTDKHGAITGSKNNTQSMTNNYYTAINIGGVNGSDTDGARRARTVTLGENVALVGDETSYLLSGITAIGTGNYVLRYDNTLYSGAGQTLTFNYTGSNPEGKTVTFFANGQALQGNTLEMPASAVTVTASLEALVHYTVRFDKNKDSATGTMDDMTFVYGTAQKLSANAFSCTGYNFNRWNTQPDGSGIYYANKELVNNLTETPDDVVVLYAQWTPVNYTITYDLAGGTVTPANPASYNIESGDITLNNPTRTGYTFSRWTWTENKKEYSAETVTIPAGSMGSRSYTAEWTGTPWTGAGTENSPYIISSTTDLDNLAIDVNHGNSFSGTFFELGQDIRYDYSLSWSTTNSSENNFSPIGHGQYQDRRNHPFSGTFDGKGHTISGIRVNHTAQDGCNPCHIGLFGKIENGTVRHVIIDNCTFKGRVSVGGIVGVNEQGTVENCKVGSDVAVYFGVAGSEGCGGIAGTNNGSILACLCEGVVSRNGKTTCNSIGGIAGTNVDGGTVKDCLFTGPPISRAEKYTGGIVGRHTDVSGVTLFNNYYTAINMGGVGVSNNSTSGKDQDGARAATVFNEMPAEKIGAPTAAYTNGLTAYEHGLAYDGTYYLDSRLTGADVVLTLAKGTKDGVTGYWATFYHGTARYGLPEGATAYTMDESKNLYRLGDDGRTIPENTAVVIIADRASITLTASVAEADIHGTNILQGGPATVSSLSGTPYVLGIVGGTMGFYKYAGAQIPEFKAYYLVTP